MNHAFKWQSGLLKDLGALFPSATNCSTALGINDRGEVVGVSTNGRIDPTLNQPEARAVLWRNGRIIDLGTFGGTLSGASTVGNQGQVAGYALNAVPDPYSIIGALFLGSPNSTQTRAFIWQNGRKRDLGTLGGPDAMIFTTGFMNARAEVAGLSYTSSTPGTTGVPPLHPFLWNGRELVDLGSLGGTLGAAFGLNNRGQVVGVSNLEGEVASHPYFWDHGVMSDIGTFGGNIGEADSLNDAGHVVGGAYFPGDEIQHAFLWSAGKRMDLGVLPGDRCSHAWSINASDQVVGKSGQCGFGIHAFIWERGEMVDLNDLIEPGSDATLVGAEIITDRGEIAGEGLPAGCSDEDVCGHPYLLVPNGECDDACEARIAARNGAMVQPVPSSIGSRTAVKATAPIDGMQVLRDHMRRVLHIP